MTDTLAGQGHNPIPPYARIEVIGGLIMVAIAALIWFGSINLSLGNLPNFGPAALPRALALPTLIILLAIGVFGLFIRGGNFGILSTPQLGLCIVGPLTVFISGCASPQVKSRELLALAFGLTALILLVFPDLLRLSIPPFPAGLHNAIPAWLGGQTALRIACVAYAIIAVALYFAPIGRRREVP
jgi:hypothetical protein